MAENSHEICVYRLDRDPLTCEICGKPAKQADAPALTVGEVLKQCNDAIALSGYFSLYWDRESGNWIVHQAGNARLSGGIRFASPDESAACAEFLRLTNPEKP